MYHVRYLRYIYLCFMYWKRRSPTSLFFFSCCSFAVPSVHVARATCFLFFLIPPLGVPHLRSCRLVKWWELEGEGGHKCIHYCCISVCTGWETEIKYRPYKQMYVCTLRIWIGKHSRGNNAGGWFEMEERMSREEGMKLITKKILPIFIDQV